MKLPINYNESDFRTRKLARLQYIEEQNNKCFYCGNSLDGSPTKDITDKKINWKLFPPNFLDYPIHLQHNHKTGMTEGAVHNYCNAFMWQYHNR